MMTRVTASVFLLASLVFAGVSSAAEKLNSRAQKELQAIEMVVQQNFTASNHEDVQGVIDTMTPDFPNREQFTEELKQFFDEVDCYMRVRSVEFVSAEMTDRGPVAVVRVVQETLAGKDGDELPYSEFRTRSAMLPPWELCEFDLEVHKLRGKWLIHEMASQPSEVTTEILQERASAADCKDGNCRLTNARVR